MSFPVSPIDGDQYTTPLGTMYEYDSTSNAWYIVSQVIEKGDTGIQGMTGPLGGPIGSTGIGLAGETGIQGVTGLRGFYGYTGIGGITGVAITSVMASTYNTTNILADTTSSSFIDIPNLNTTLVLDSSSYIFSTMSFQAESDGTGSYPTGGFRIVITPGPDSSADTSGTELQRFFTPDNIGISTVTHYDGFFAAPASYNIQGQFRRVSGQQAIKITDGQIFAQSFVGERGMAGADGLPGLTGIYGETGVQGTQGLTGVYGLTGLYVQGVTGIYGLTGVYGTTGLYGRTGLQGYTGVTWFRPLTTDFKTLEDTTAASYDTTNWSLIPDMSTSVTVDSSGSYIFAMLTTETDSSSPGSYVTGGLRLAIDGTNSMEFSRFIQNNDDIEINTIDFRSGPYDTGTYVTQGEARRIDGDRPFRVRKGHLFVQALQSGVGDEGPVGPRGEVGYTGIQGLTGILGLTGLQGKGETGIRGLTGILGHTGLALGSTGIQGLTGLSFTGIRGLTGVQGLGVTGLVGTTGLVGPSGGDQGVTGLSGTGTTFSFNPVCRYEVSNTSGYETWLVSSSTVYHGLMWDRTGTTLNLYRESHGHAAGNRIIARNINLDYQTALIDSTTADSFSITTTDTSATSGSLGAYSLGFTFAYDGYPSSGGTVSAPSGDHADSQLISMSLRTGIRTSTIFDLEVPASAINGAGANTNLTDCYVPDFNVRNDADSLTVVGASMVTGSGSGSFSTFRFGALGSGSLSRIISVHF